MKIVEDNEKVLRLEEKNGTIVVLAAVIITFCLVRTGFLIHAFGLAYEHYLHWIFLALLAGVSGSSFTEEVRVTFHLTTQVMDWERKKIFRGKNEGRLPFASVEDVRLGYKGTGRFAKYRLELVVAGEPFPLSQLYSQGMTAKANCDRIGQRILETLGKG